MDGPSIETTSSKKELRDEWLDTDGKIMKPTQELVFGSIEELSRYYSLYAQQEGFAVIKNTRKLGDDGQVRNQVLQCSRGLKSRTYEAINNPVRSTKKTDCGAKVRASRQPDGSFKLTTIVLEHNHDFTPGKTRCFRRPRYVDMFFPKRNEPDDQCRMRVCEKNSDALVVEVGGSRNLGFNEKDARYGKLCSKFFELATLAAADENKYNIVMDGLCNLMDRVKKGDGRSVNNNQVNQHSSAASLTHVNMISETLTTTKVISPLHAQQEDHRNTNTTASKTDEFVQNARNGKNKEADDESSKNKRKSKKKQQINKDQLPTSIPTSFYPQPPHTYYFGSSYVLPPIVTNEQHLNKDIPMKSPNHTPSNICPQASQNYCFGVPYAVPPNLTTQPHLLMAAGTSQENRIAMEGRPRLEH